MNTEAINVLSERVDQLDKDVKTYIDSRITKVKSEINSQILETSSIPENMISELRKDISTIKRKQKCGDQTMNLISDSIANVQDQLDLSVILINESSESVIIEKENVTIVDNMSRNDQHTTLNPILSSVKNAECDLIRDSIENPAKLIS